jgi:hypothetical protein
VLWRHPRGSARGRLRRLLPKPVRAEALFAALQAHLGVRFVSSAEAGVERRCSCRLPRPARLAAACATPWTVGAITDLEALAQELMAGEAGEAALGRRIGALVTKFDFDGCARSPTRSSRRDVGPMTARLRSGPRAAACAARAGDDSRRRRQPVNLQVLVRTLHGTDTAILGRARRPAALEIARRAGPT